MDSHGNLSVDYALEDYEFGEEFQAAREREASIEMILLLYIQPCLLVVGFICNVLVIVSVLTAPSLKRQSRGVYVLTMAVLDNLLLIITGLYLLTMISAPLQDALLRNLHGCRFAFYGHYIPLASQWFLPVIVWEICLARHVSGVWRKLSTPRVAASLVLIIMVFNILYCLVRMFGTSIELKWGFCIIKDPSVLETIRRVDVALYDILPLLALVLALPVLCVRNQPRGHQGFASSQPANAQDASYLAYQQFDQGTSAATTATTQANGRARIAFENLSPLPVVSLVFFTVLILPFAIIALIGSHWFVGAHIYRALHMLLLCFYQFKLFVYIVGWREFRERFVQLARDVALCIGCRRVGNSSDEEAAIVLGIVPSDFRTTPTNDDE